MKQLAKIVVCSMLLLTIAASCTKTEYKKIEGMVWNTIYHISYDSDKELNDSIIDMFQKVASGVSAFDSTSIVSRVNRNDSVAVDRYFREVFALSKIINKNSYGAFDPTISPLINAWGFGYDTAVEPDKINVDSLLDFVGMDKVEISGSRVVKKDNRLTFNFSAIAKGYGCDMIAEMLKRNGVNNFLIEVGGEIVTCGLSERGGKWRVSIDRPEMGQGKVMHNSQAVIELSDAAVATSGNYRNYRVENGQRIAHTINPKTGLPVQTDVLSATIVSETCAQSDAYATACMVLGFKDAQKMIAQQNLSAMLILSDGNVWMSENFKMMIIK